MEIRCIGDRYIRATVEEEGLTDLADDVKGEKRRRRPCLGQRDVMPLPIGKLTRRSILDGVAAVAVPVNPEAIAIVKVEIEISCSRIRFKGQSVLASRRIGAALLPEIE